MRKQIRQYLRRSLCGVLSAAMILTGSSFAGMTVYAAQPDVEDSGLTDGQDDSQIDETSSADAGDVTQNPVASDNDVTGNENGTGNDDVDQEDPDGQDQSGNDTLSPDDGEDSGSSEEGDIEKDDLKDGADDLDDPDDADGDAKEDIKPVAKKNSVGVMGTEDGTTTEYGTLVNGDFENGTKVNNVWTPDAWTYDPGFTGTGDGFQTKTIGSGHGQNSLYIWRDSVETEISVSQVVSNMEPGAYIVSMNAGGIYTKDQINLKVERVEQTDENDKEYSSVIDSLVTQSLGECDGWEKWNEIATEPFQVAVPEGKSEVNVKITISGKIGVNREEQLNIDDISFVTCKLADLNALLEEANGKKETDYTPETWLVFKDAKDKAANLVSDSATTDATKALEIVAAYAALKKAKDGLEPAVSEMGTLYFYSDALKEYTDSDSVTYHLYMSTWDKSKAMSSKEEVELSQGTWSYTAYMFDKVTDETVNLGYADWYSIPVKVISADAADKNGFIIQTGKKEGSGETVKHTALESDKGLIKLSGYSDNNPDIYKAIADLGAGGSIAIKDGKAFDSIKAAEEAAEADKITLEKLQELVNEAKKLKEEAFKSGWEAFQTALEAAEAVVKKADDAKTDTTVTAPTDEEIATAYNNLQSAMEALKPLSTTVKLYYYVGETEDEIGLHYWDNSTEKTNLTSTAKMAGWSVKEEGDTYLMTEEEGYTGWYSIPVTFMNDGGDAGFKIFTKTAATAADEAQKTPLYACDETTENHPEMYGKLTSGENDTFAIKNDIGYEGAEKTTQIMRNVTFYVYSEDVIPAIQLDNKSAGTELTEVNEQDGSSKKLTESGNDSDGNPVYELQLIKDHENWYSLTFSAPAQFKEGSKKIAGLYGKNSSGSYEWMKDLLDGQSNDYGIDFSEVFAGNNYYKDGTFYASMEEAEKVTLLQLKNLIASEKITNIIANGETYYTPETWTAFSKAKDQADKAVSDHSTEDDGYVGEDIKTAYNALNAAADNMVSVVDESVTLYFYSEALKEYTDSDTETYHLYMSTWDKNKIASSKEEIKLSQGTWDYTAYMFDKVTDETVNMGYADWYSIPVKAIAANDGADGDGFIIQTGKAVTADNKVTHSALESNTGLIKLTYWDNNDIYAKLVSLEAGGSIAIKDGKAFDSIQAAEEASEADKITLEKLQKLVDEAKKLKQEDYKKGWEAFQKALAAAEAVVQAAEDAKADATKVAPTDEEIEKAYKNLKAAIDALVDKNAVDSTVNVAKIALTDDFITGADLSSYLSLRESGTVFKDEQGNPLSDAEFFKYLHDGGTNWVRIRIWNDPYDGSGRGYGGGNNDLEKAKTIGKLASDAGMKVLIDFHYSDFWADPGKQQAPKSWKAFSLAEKEAAVESYTLSSLNALRDAGVNVGMVQVGNETNNAICGETSRENMAKIFNAGSKAVKTFDPQCLVALHFTNPEKGGYHAGWAADLEKYEVNYDVFATSYYPFWHGTTKNLNEVLAYIAEKYDKKVMVAETSWTTGWEDGDGHENTAPRTTQDLGYDISLQGQADEIRDVVNAVNSVNDVQPGKAIGVFYWEPAWISPYYVYDEDGNVDEKLFKQNQAAWEKYGSGWAASYASEYDPDDAGKWYGGSAVDNQSWFDFDGTALATAKVYSMIRTGAVAERAISSIGFNKEQNPLEVPLGVSVEWPKAEAVYNDGTHEQLEVQWDEDEKEAVNTNKAGEYVVHGIVAQGGKEYKLTLTVKVMMASSANILKNPGMEDGLAQTDWKVSGAADCISAKEKDWKENPRTGTYAMNFWSQDPAEFTVSQTVTPEAGTYTFGGYIQGDGAGTEDVQYAFVEVSGEGGKFRRQAAFTLNGWRNWSNPEIADIEIADGDSVTVGVTIAATETGSAGVWGSMDDFYLYGTHSVSITDDIEHGSVETSVVKADSGERVIVTVTPDQGYYLDTMTLSGASITAENYANILASTNGTVAFQAASGEGTTNAAVLTYAVETAEAKSDSFTMPNGNVTVNATFKSVFGESADKIDLNAKDEAGNYLVQVNTGASDSPAGESPIPAQFHTGKNVTPAVELSYKGYKLTTADYTVKYANNKNLTTADSKAKITLTAKGDKFTGVREILFEIKEDTRKEFSAKKLKVVYEASDKNGRTDKPAKAVYYLGKEKEIEPKISLYNTADDITDTSKAIDTTLYTVYYQNNKKTGKATLVVLPTDKALNDPNGYKEGSITTTFTIAKCPVNQGNVKVEVSTAKNYYNVGKKVEPSVTVTYTYTEQNGAEKTVKLAKGTDYTVTYTNNVNASVYKTTDENGTDKYEPIKANKVPTIKITGKGNFAGVRTTEDLVGTNNKPGTQKFTFEIRPRNLKENTTMTAADLAVSTKSQTPKITVKDGTKAVAASQYEITRIKRTHDADGTVLATDKVETIYSKADGTGVAKVTAAGTYEVTIAAKTKANYEGEATATFRVVDKAYLIPNAKITVSGKFYYTGKPVELTTTGEAPNLKVSFGKGGNATVLTEQSSAKSDQDGYYVSYTNHTNAGRATVTITGTGKYVGTKTATFAINKRILAFPGTVKENEKSKKGELQSIKLSAKSMAAKYDSTWTRLEGTDVESILINSDNTAEMEYGSLAIPYTGNTLNPEFKFYSSNCDAAQNAVPNELSSSDYTVTYAIGKWVEGKAIVTATIKGKGNYSGSVKLPNLFTVTARNLKDFSIDVSSVTYNGKALKPAVTFRDRNGKVVDLKLNTAYSVSYKNNKDIMSVSKKQPTLTVKVKGNGWITDNNDLDTKSRTLNFTINQAEITKMDVGDVKFQSFLGKALKPKVTIKVNGRKLKEGKDYELTYSNNGKRSGSTTATVQITGKGNYFTRKPIEKTFVIK